ncbi:MAG: diacylglycerol kinase family protein [Luteolibacter sp.]
MNFEVVINKESGSGFFRDMEMQNRLRRVFTDRGHTAGIHIVPPADLDKTLQRLAHSDSSALIVGGGDGTITSAASLLRDTETALGVLPLGTFNLEARDLNIHLDPFEAAAQLIDSTPIEIDILTVNDECCLCATVIGFYPALAKSRAEFHGRSWWAKSIRIIREILTVAVSSPALDLEITANGETLRSKTRLAAFAPGHYIESAGIIPDRDSLSSGELSAYVSEHLSRTQMLSAAWGYLTGTLFDTDEMKRIAATEITLNVRRRKCIPTMIDGEILSMELPCKLKIHPRALKVLRPNQPAR